MSSPTAMVGAAAVLCVLVVASAEQTVGPTGGGILFDNATKLLENLHQNSILMEEYRRSSSNSSHSTDNSSDELTLGSMPACRQYCSEWCWATASAMLIDHYKGTSTCDSRECAIASREMKHQCCPASHACKHSPNDQPSSCNHAGQPSQIIDAIDHYAGKKCKSEGPLSQSSLDKALKSAPIVVLVAWQGGGGHAIVVGSHPKHKDQYSVHNPWHWAPTASLPPWKTLNYGQLLHYTPAAGSVGKWAESVVCPGSSRRRRSKGVEGTDDNHHGFADDDTSTDDHDTTDSPPEPESCTREFKLLCPQCIQGSTVSKSCAESCGMENKAALLKVGCKHPSEYAATESNFSPLFCSHFQCKSKCDCLAKHCKKDLSACYKEKSCKAIYDCAEKCSCHGIGCAMKCQKLKQTTAAKTLTSCAKKHHCTTETEAWDATVQDIVV